MGRLFIFLFILSLIAPVHAFGQKTPEETKALSDAAIDYIDFIAFTVGEFWTSAELVQLKSEIPRELKPEDIGKVNELRREIGVIEKTISKNVKWSNQKIQKKYAQYRDIEIGVPNPGAPSKKFGEFLDSIDNIASEFNNFVDLGITLDGFGYDENPEPSKYQKVGVDVMASYNSLMHLIVSNNSHLAGLVQRTVANGDTRIGLYVREKFASEIAKIKWQDDDSDPFVASRDLELAPAIQVEWVFSGHADAWMKNGAKKFQESMEE